MYIVRCHVSGLMPFFSCVGGVEKGWVSESILVRRDLVCINTRFRHCRRLQFDSLSGESVWISEISSSPSQGYSFWGV